ncbi:hypothetical protein ACBQ21_08935 [Pseudomonas putida]|uniref:hypothetical protein n=1 Tax=Pseudomonas putida TaxID=303 RepID=UPI003525DA88
MSKHTPGPWRVGKHYSEVIADMPADPPFRGMTDDCVKHYGGYLVAESCAEADGRLIAVAPELLEVCEGLIQLRDSAPEDLPAGFGFELIQKARATIAKTRGEQ